MQPVLTPPPAPPPHAGLTTMANSDSPEYKAFQAMYATLHCALDPSAVAPPAFSRDLLTTNEKAAATNRLHTDADRMEGLLNAVEKRILADPRAFHTFVDVLKDEGAFSALVDKLNGKFSDEL